MKYPLLALSLLVILNGTAQEILRPVQLKSGSLEKTTNLRNNLHLTDSLVKYRFRNRFYTLIQFSKLPDLAERQALAREGILLYDYIPDNTFLAEINDQLSPAKLQRNTISGVYTLNTKAKIAPVLKQQLSAHLQDPDKLIAVSFYGNIDKTTAIAELQHSGAQIVETKIQPAHVVFINANETDIEKIAALPFVAYISSQQMKPVTLNYRNRGVHGVNAIAATAGRNLQGNGIVLGHGDDGDVTAHLDLSGRVINRNPAPYTLHGTATMGTMGGGGIINQKYKGMAPRATLISQYFSDILVNTPYYVADYGMVITNNSYHSAANGCAGEGDYDVLSNYIDAQLNNDLSLLHVFASGNDGALTCSPYPGSFATIKSGFQTGKNVLTVGNVDNSNNYTIANSSSRGPVDDGRLKPEIVAGGFAIGSSVPTNNYQNLFGTSMSAPTVSGALGLLYERYRQLHGGTNPTGALIKAIACNTADDLGNAGPDFTYGFGNLNALNAVEALENNTYFNGVVNNGGSQNFTITGVPAGTKQIKIMLYYSDPAGTPYAATPLVNNLNLTVTAPDASVHNPLILNPSVATVNNLAVEGVDNRNNIEQVVINNPPAGDFTVTVTGAAVPQGPQDYVVAYQIIAPAVRVMYPYGEDTWVPGEAEIIRWSATDDNTNTFTIEYSTNNGSNWTVIDNNVAANLRLYNFTTPNTPTTQALVRVSRNGSGYTDVSNYAFTILALPAVTITNTCPGYASLTWSAIAGATSYDVMMYKGNDMSVVENITGTSYLLGGLNKDSTYYLAVRAVIGSIPGRRCVAQPVTPSGGACASPTFDNDLTASVLVAPATGRMFTTSQLGTVAPQVTIKNMGSAAFSGAFNITYQVNNGTPVTEATSQSIAANSTYTHTFAATYDFSATNTYTVKAWVDCTADPSHLNDTLVTVVKHLQNDPVPLTPSFTEGFESAAAKAYVNGTRGFDGLDRADFFSHSTNGRVRTFVNSGFARTGNRAATLDQITNLNIISTDSLITTFNLGAYAPTDQIWLSFYFRNQGIDFSAGNNRVYIRGSETGAWIPVYTLPINSADFGVYRAATPVNITETLANAVPAQSVSSSFQVKFCEQGYRSANSVIVDGNLDDGYTFDDITLTLTTDDVSMLQLVNPAPTNVCALSNAETITVQVKNYSTGTLTNIPVSYQIDNGTVVTENIPSINAGQTLNFSFAQTANLSTFKQYTITSWVSYATDSYHVNDTITSTFRTSPLITSYPYLESFESNDGNWYTGGFNSSWEWGTPAATIINKAANGTKAWVTNLTGNHNNNEFSYLYSPCFDLSAMTQPVLSFSHIFRTEDNCNCDFHWVEYSTDGTTWNKLGTSSGGTNWYDNPLYQAWKMSVTRWQVSSFDVPVNNSKVRFRIVMYGDPGVTYEGVGIDDIHVFDKAAIYTGASITSGLAQTVSGNNWIHFNSGSNRVVSINPHGQNLGNTDVSVYINPAIVRNDGTQYYLDRNIVIRPAIAPSGPVSVRFYFTNTEVNNMLNETSCPGCSNLTSAYDAGITKYSGTAAEENGTIADNSSGIKSFITPSNVDIMPYDNGYYAEYQVSSFSEFWINGGGSGQNQPLPLVLGIFTVTKNNETALLQWTTLQEINTAEFIIERSTDGIHYEPIGSVAAGGNTTTESIYQFIDKQMAAGINYYRIRTVDKDAKYSWSPVRSVNNTDGDFTISVLPNPVTKGMVYINTSVNCNRIELRDVAGRLVKTMNVKGTHNPLQVGELKKGMYFATVITDNGDKIEKIVIQ